MFPIVPEAKLKANYFYKFSYENSNLPFYFGSRKHFNVLTDFGTRSEDLMQNGNKSLFYKRIFMPEIENRTYSYEDNQAFFAGIISSGQCVILLSDINMYTKPCASTIDEILWLKVNGYTFMADPINKTHTWAIPPKKLQPLLITSYESQKYKYNFSPRKQADAFKPSQFLAKNLDNNSANIIKNRLFLKFHNIHSHVMKQRLVPQELYKQIINLVEFSKARPSDEAINSILSFFNSNPGASREKVSEVLIFSVCDSILAIGGDSCNSRIDLVLEIISKMIEHLKGHNAFSRVFDFASMVESLKENLTNNKLNDVIKNNTPYLVREYLNLSKNNGHSQKHFSMLKIWAERYDLSSELTILADSQLQSSDRMTNARVI